MDQAKILIVDDEPNVRFVLEKILKNEGYDLESAANGAEALQKLHESCYDLLLLDLYMEGMSGLQVLEVVRSFDQNLVVIILTAQGSMESAVEGLRQGAFDYLFKPAVPDVIRERVREGLEHRKKTLQQLEIIARAKTIHQKIERQDLQNEDPINRDNVNNRFVHSGSLIIDRHHREATLNEKLLELTTTEFEILTCLVTAEPNIVSPKELVTQVMGYDVKDSEARSTIKYHIHNLRRKIEPDPTNPKHLKTIRYKGYLWVSK